jgi:hypothetical protein
METPRQNDATPDSRTGDGCMARLVRESLPTPRTDAADDIGMDELYAESCKLERELAAVQMAYGNQYFRVKGLLEALEAADECLALLEDVGHGAHMDNVTVARGIIAKVLYPANNKADPR